MAFDAVAGLYVVTGSNASSSIGDNKLWKVDRINGEVTQKYSLWGGNMETCDCILGDPITSVEVSGNLFYDTNEDTTFIIYCLTIDVSAHFNPGFICFIIAIDSGMSCVETAVIILICTNSHTLSVL